MIRVGFTGTRQGMTTEQRNTLRWLLANEVNASVGTPEFHHGDCVGADTEAAEVAAALGFKIVSHPADGERYRANSDADEEWPPKPPLVRNHEIVEATQSLIAIPHGPELQRSGTWATVRHARRRAQPRLIIEPNGSYHRDTKC